MTLKDAGLAGDIRRFFTANADEELSLSDIQIKFAASPQLTNYAVRQLELEGLLEKFWVVRVKPLDKASE